MQKKLRPIDLIRNANKGKKKTVKIQIPIGDEKYINAILSAPDILTIGREQTRQGKLAYARIAKEEPDAVKTDIIESDWQAKLDMQDDPEIRERMKKENRPKNLAEQMAQDESTSIVIEKLLPKYLRGLDGKLLFPTQEEREMFREEMLSDLKFYQDISKKYIDLITDYMKTEQLAKNLSKEENSQSMSSKKDSQDDTPDTERHSQKS